MTPERVHLDVVALNVRMLSLVQQMSQNSPAEAMLRTGLTHEKLKSICDMSTDEIHAVASEGKLVFMLDHPIVGQSN